MYVSGHGFESRVRSPQISGVPAFTILISASVNIAEPKKHNLSASGEKTETNSVSLVHNNKRVPVFTQNSHPGVVNTPEEPWDRNSQLF